MKSAKIWILTFLVLVLGILIGLQLAMSPMLADLTADRQMPPAETASATTAPTATGKAAEPESDQPGQERQSAELDRDYLEQVLTNANIDQRQQLLEDSELFRRFVDQEASNRSLRAAAMANGVHKNNNVQFLMDRAGNNVLREIYMNQLMQDQFPADFPSDEQLRQFYEANPDQFSMKQRMQVWQVFLEVPADAGAEQDGKIEQQARELLEQIRKNKLDFASAAVEHSAHEASRRNDGYMGLVETGQLKPAIADALKDLKQGEPGIVRSEDGWHVLKKGRTLEAELLPLEDVRQEATRLLINQARQQFRQAVIEEARKTYSYMPGDNRIEQWRLELKTAIHGSDENAE